MSRTLLVGLVVALAVGIGVVSWQLHEERKDDVSIELGQSGLKIDSN